MIKPITMPFLNPDLFNIQELGKAIKNKKYRMQ